MTKRGWVVSTQNTKPEPSQSGVLEPGLHIRLSQRFGMHGLHAQGELLPWLGQASQKSRQILGRQEGWLQGGGSPALSQTGGSWLCLTGHGVHGWRLQLAIQGDTAGSLPLQPAQRFAGAGIELSPSRRDARAAEQLQVPFSPHTGEPPLAPLILLFGICRGIFLWRQAAFPADPDASDGMTQLQVWAAGP